MHNLEQRKYEILTKQTITNRRKPHDVDQLSHSQLHLQLFHRSKTKVISNSHVFRKLLAFHVAKMVFYITIIIQLNYDYPRKNGSMKECPLVGCASLKLVSCKT